MLGRLLLRPGADGAGRRSRARLARRDVGQPARVDLSNRLRRVKERSIGGKSFGCVKEPCGNTDRTQFELVWFERPPRTWSRHVPERCRVPAVDHGRLHLQSRLASEEPKSVHEEWRRVPQRALFHDGENRRFRDLQASRHLLEPSQMGSRGARWDPRWTALVGALDGEKMADSLYHPGQISGRSRRRNTSSTPIAMVRMIVATTSSSNSSVLMRTERLCRLRSRRSTSRWCSSRVEVDRGCHTGGRVVLSPRRLGERQDIQPGSEYQLPPRRRRVDALHQAHAEQPGQVLRV